MVTTRKQSAKEREGLTSHLRNGRKELKRLAHPPLTLPSVTYNRIHNQLTQLKSERRSRSRRLQVLILGVGRTFSGTIIVPNDHDARETDLVRFSDIGEAIAFGHAAVCWTDGSCTSQGVNAGFMGAGVVWQHGMYKRISGYKLGRYTGDSEDAEIFAIAAALGRAKKEMDDGKKFQLVRVYSDAREVLKGIKHGTQYHFGPMLAERTALQGLYERAEYLTEQGIAVQLVWVKGHSGSEGNRLADQAAARAVKEQAKLIDRSNPEDNALCRRPMIEADVPVLWKELGSDWADEWLSRANVHIQDTSFRKKHLKLSNAWLEAGVEASALSDERQIKSDFERSDKRGFILLEHNRYGNVTLDQVIADLQDKSSLVEFQIVDLQHYIARSVQASLKGHMNRDLTELRKKYAMINKELRAYVAERMAQGCAMDEAAQEIGMQKNDGLSRGEWVREDLMAMLEYLDVDIDEQLAIELQIQEDIVLSEQQRSARWGFVA